MKKTLTSNICKGLFAFTVLLFVSCEDNGEAFPHAKTDTKITPRTTSLSALDGSYVMEYDYTTENGATIESMSVNTDDNTSNPLTLDGNVASFNSSVFGSMKGGGTESFDLVATRTDGYSFRTLMSISVSKAIKAKKTPDAILYNSNAEDTLTVKTSTVASVVESLSLYSKVNHDGTYSMDTNYGTLNPEEQSIYFRNVDSLTYNYNLMENDTLYYKFIARSGSLADSIEVKLPIIKQGFSSSVSDVSITDTDELRNYNLGTSEAVPLPDTDGVAEIMYSSGMVMKAGTTDIEFAEITDLTASGLNSNQEVLAENNVLITQNLFGANTAVTSFTPSPDQLIAYKVVRDGTTSYGLILVTETFDNQTGNGFKFNYGEGARL